MKWLGIGAALVLVLLVMRAASWIFGWLLSRIPRAGVKRIAVISNLLAFGVFALLLWLDLSPGEPIDAAALLFGLVVFVLYCTSDLLWRPWKARP
jgi:Ca2+/Na+ antiporter